MKMPKYQLFLGFPVKKEVAHVLEKADEKIKKAFINEEECYLTVINMNETQYLGRFIGTRSDLQTLHSVEENIYSLLRRIVPSYPFDKTPLKLFPAEKQA